MTDTLVTLLFIVTFAGGMAALMTAGILFRTVGDRWFALMFRLFAGLSVQAFAFLGLEIVQRSSTILGPGVQITAYGFVLASVFIMAFVTVQVAGRFWGIGRPVFTDLVLGSMTVVLLMAAATGFDIDPVHKIIRLGPGRYALLWFFGALTWSVIQSIRRLGTLAGTERKNILRLLLLTATFTPLFLWSFWPWVANKEVPMGLSLVPMVPFCTFYLVVAGGFCLSVFRRFSVVEKGLAPTEVPPAQGFVAPGRVTRRELEVMDLVLRGKDNKQIAGELGISLATVKLHVSRIFRKLRVQSRYELISRYATRTAASPTG